MEFQNKLSDEACIEWFKKLFGRIWNQSGLEEIIFLDGIKKVDYYNALSEKNNELKKEETKLSSLAGFLGNSFWDVFSNNHSVYLINGNVEFDIGSFRGSGSFLSEFIESENASLQFSYMDFYMGHFKETNDAARSYGFIFEQLKKNGFDWQYAYPELGIVDFSKAKEDRIEDYNPNKSLEDEIGKQNILKLINEINEETFNRIQNSPMPTIIRAYIKVFNKFPQGWIEN